MKSYRICFGTFSPRVKGPCCRGRLPAVPATWLIVRRWCITRFSLCLSVDCESHLTGLARSSPARMRRAQQDASIASLLCVRQKKNDRERERKDGVTESENGIRVRPLGFLPQHALHFSLPEGEEGIGQSKVVLLILSDDLEFHIKVELYNWISWCRQSEIWLLAIVYYTHSLFREHDVFCLSVARLFLFCLYVYVPCLSINLRVIIVIFIAVLTGFIRLPFFCSTRSYCCIVFQALSSNTSTRQIAWLQTYYHELAIA